MFCGEAFIRLCIRLTNPKVEKGSSLQLPKTTSVDFKSGIRSSVCTRCMSALLRLSPVVSVQFGPRCLPFSAFQLSNHAIKQGIKGRKTNYLFQTKFSRDIGHFFVKMPVVSLPTLISRSVSHFAKIIFFLPCILGRVLFALQIHR